MAVSKPEIVSFVEIGNPVTHLRVVFDYNISDGPDLKGFLAEWNDNQSWVPVWDIPPAVDIGIPESDNGVPVQRRILFIDVATGFVSWWETFEEYGAGLNARLTHGGGGWDGYWSTQENTLGNKDYGDDFESYPIGLNNSLNAGTGWSGGW